MPFPAHLTWSLLAKFRADQAFAPYLHLWPMVLVGLVVIIGLKIIKSPAFKGWFGEWAVNRGLRSLPEADYRHFSDLYLPHPTEEGTTQLDHVVVAPFGIFVIETKNYRGWIFGSEKQREWTQQIYRRKHKFQNPLHQNELHIKALMKHLELPREAFYSVIMFIGDSTIKTELPDYVMTRGLCAWIQKQKQKIIAPDDCGRISKSLESLDQSTDRRQAAKAHVAALQNRHGGKAP